MISFEPKIYPIGARESFETDLYLEHLEEASSIYERRSTYFDDPEVTWIDIEELEIRLESHIDGLVLGGNLALNVCKTQAQKGDSGELFAAICVFCKQRQWHLIEEVLKHIDLNDSLTLQAITDALKLEMPFDLENKILRILFEGDKRLRPISTKLIAHRRLSHDQSMYNWLNTDSSDLLASILRVIGRLKNTQWIELLRKHLKHDDAVVCKNAALSLLRLGDRKCLEKNWKSIDKRAWFHIPLALGGEQSEINTLIQSIEAGEGNTDTILALGLYGDISCTPLLLKLLDDKRISTYISIALNLILGADLYEDVFMPDEFSEDELFDEEIEEYEKGNNPVKIDGQPFGENITRLSQNSNDWKEWWKENQNRFAPHIRYRNGESFSPLCLLKNLEDEKSPRFVRQMAYEEFVIRYGIDFHFETDMYVSQQKQAIANYKGWVQKYHQRFQPGEWYFAGKLIS